MLVILIAALVRMPFFWLFPPGPDECSYWDWSRHLDLGFVDHPPLVAYLIRLAAIVFTDTVWAPRLIASILAAATAWLIFVTARRMFGSRAAFWSATLYTCCPMFTMAAGILLIPESLLAFFIALSLYLATRLIEHDNPRWFLGLGVVMGFALLSKYPGVLVLLGLGLFAVVSPRHRYWFARPQPYLMVVIAVVMFLPVVIWNTEHHWAGLGFLSRRTTATTGTPGWAGVLQSLTGQAAYHSPLTFFVLIAGVVVTGVRGLIRGDDRYLLCFCFSGPVIAAFIVVCAFRETLPHWPASGYIAAYIAVPAALGLDARRAHASSPKRLTQTTLCIAATVGACQSLLLPVLLLYPVTTVTYKRWARRSKALPATVEPMAELYGWNREVRDKLLGWRDRIVRDTHQPPVVLTHYHLLAALLRRAMGDELTIFSLHHDAYQYDIWYDDDDATGKTVIYVSSDNNQFSRGRPQDYYVFDRCDEQPPINIVRYGVTINQVHCWICTGYQGAVSTGDTPQSPAPTTDAQADRDQTDRDQTPGTAKQTNRSRATGRDAPDSPTP